MRRSKRCLYIGDATVGAPSSVADDAAAEHAGARARIDVVDRVHLARRQQEHGDGAAVDERGHAAVGDQLVERADRRPRRAGAVEQAHASVTGMRWPRTLTRAIDGSGSSVLTNDTKRASRSGSPSVAVHSHS